MRSSRTTRKKLLKIIPFIIIHEKTKASPVQHLLTDDFPKINLKKSAWPLLTKATCPPSDVGSERTTESIFWQPHPSPATKDAAPE
ncbi:hypothetical protein AVEN_227235-1 [Araneus ventricosus]|uniref:Uncharacterized protein n=1 Tax=Araneus ventricosus TaxID=182803 RepID=A0A4Y2IMS3_ARAVE|nr:hypothetical protein AVEN_227235-1 [Araneus ventricosus]